MYFKELREGEQEYIFRVYYVNLFKYHFWFSSLIPVDSSYHLVLFLYFKTALLPHILCVVIVKCNSKYYRPNDTIIYIQFYAFAF